MFEGEPPITHRRVEETASKLPEDDQSLPQVSMGAPASRAGPIEGHPDIEGYRIIEPLGQGGMGMVWRAEQLSTRREVALKLLISQRVDSPKAQARFQREVELTARLDHPNIARIYDSGLHQGMYYYAMELIEGIPLDQYVTSQSLSRTEILALMQKVCQAVLYAHLRAVIHRDLKPSNVLVSPDGRPHILDFGLAKALLDEDEALTISIEGQIAGTPAYMSPEQAAGHHSQLDTRTDVYSLGVILYELLLGQSPHDLGSSMFGLLNQIAEGTIRRPREINKSIDSELEAILLKALALNPEDRYASAGALAKDINNYLDEEPLDAQVPTTLYFLRKKVRKYRVQVSVTAAVLALLFGTILAVYTRLVADKAVREAQATELELKSQELTWAELELMALSGDREQARAALGVLRGEYVSAQEEIGRLNHKLGEREPPVAVRRVGLQPGRALASFALVRKPLLPAVVQSWTLETHGHRGPVAKLVYSPDGSQLMSASNDGAVRIWDLESGKLTRIIVDPDGTVDLPWFADDRDVGRFSWSADKAARPIDEITRLWRVDVPDVWQPLLRMAIAAAISPDRTKLAFGDRDGTIRVLDLESGQLQYTTIPAWCGPVHSVRLSSDGKVLATYSGSGTICLWDAHRWQPLGKFEAESITGSFPSAADIIAWGPGDAFIARLNIQRDALEILDSLSGQVLRVLSGHGRGIASISWSRNSTLLVAGTIDGKALVWDVESDSNEPLVTLNAHAGSVNALAWQSQNQSLITAGDDGKIKIWDPRSGTRTRSIEGYPAPITCLAFSPEGNILAAGSDNGIIRLWDAGGGWTSRLLRSEPNDIEAGEAKLMAVTWSPDGTLLASGDAAGKVRIWDPTSRRPMRTFEVNCGPINPLAWSADGRTLICGGLDGTVRTWDAKNDFQEHVVLLPLWGSVGPGIAINREGDYRGPPGIAAHLLYVVSTERGQETLTPADFKSRFGWVNEPWQVGLYAPGAEQVKRIYVKADAQPPYDGNSWDTAYSDLQDALKLAQPDTEIWVAAGTYRPDRGTDAREASFRLKSGIRLFGGFAGTETSIDQRDPNRYETILSGDLEGNDRPDFTDNDENSYHVVDASEADETTVLDGVVISGGNASGLGPPHIENPSYSGGGIYNNGGGLTIVHCVFRYNLAKAAGGGIFNCGSEKRLTISNCVFMRNSVTEEWAKGGGIYNSGAYCILSNCRFVDNSAYVGGGGGMANTGCPEITLTKCTFANNSGRYGGGIWHNACGHSTFAECVFVSNSAGNDGGGIANWASSPNLINCTFVGNTFTALGVTGASGGGGMSIGYQSCPTLINCMFMANRAEGSGGGVINLAGCEPIFANCIFTGNVAHTGGGMCSSGVAPEGSPIRFNDSRLDNCTFSGNIAKVTGGGIVNAEGSRSRMYNCIIWSNSDSSGIGESAQFANARTDLNSAVNHCCIQGWSGRLGGSGNFTLDPLFVDPDGPDGKTGTLDDNLRLDPTSPCRNAGDNSALGADRADLDRDGDVNEPIPFDIDGKSRILNRVVDLGAHESG
ncbi:MAG: protein kinase domain-containing protein [Planctomycetota bacterium]